PLARRGTAHAPHRPAWPVPGWAVPRRGAGPPQSAGRAWRHEARAALGDGDARDPRVHVAVGRPPRARLDHDPAHDDRGVGPVRLRIRLGFLYRDRALRAAPVATSAHLVDAL